MKLSGRILVAELVGTAILMMGGPGSAVLAGERIGTLGVALAFGLSLLVIAYAIGPVSGGHVNPAVTLAMLLARKCDGGHALMAVVGQLVGAAVGGFVVWGIASGREAFDATNNFAANGWGDFSPGGYPLASAIAVEVVFTAVLVFVVLSTTSRRFSASATGLTVGMTLALIHLISIPVDNTSVNPARSFGAAIFAGADALAQLWAFVVFPLVGALVGLLVWLAVDVARLEDTALGEVTALTSARNVVAGAGDKVLDLGEQALARADRDPKPSA